MAFKSEATNDGRQLDAARLSEHGSHGGLLATLLSAVALGFSGFTYYDSSLKTADLTVYVPPMIHYGRDGEADVFNIPITIANEGARTGTVLTMELDENLKPNAEKKTAKFHSAFLGDYPATTRRSAVRSRRCRFQGTAPSPRLSASIRWISPCLTSSMTRATIGSR
jgi:hypothetical protein